MTRLFLVKACIQSYQFKDYSPKITKSKAKANYEFGLEGGGKMMSIGNAIASNLLAGPDPRPWTGT
jgi:hypothetical protein